MKQTRKGVWKNLLILLLVGAMTIQIASASEGFWQLMDEKRESTNGEESSYDPSKISLVWADSETAVAGKLIYDSISGCTHLLTSTFSWSSPPLIIKPNTDFSVPIVIDQQKCTGECQEMKSSMVVEYGSQLQIFQSQWTENVPCKNEIIKKSKGEFESGWGPDLSVEGAESKKNRRVIVVTSRLHNDYYKVIYTYQWVNQGTGTEPEIVDTGTQTNNPGVKFEWSNVNSGSQDYGPPMSDTTFEISDTITVTYLESYHISPTGGAQQPIYITLVNSDGTEYGPFLLGTTQLSNQHWTLELGEGELVLPPGSYTVVNADPDTWASNSESGYAGFFSIVGKTR